jgi:hypothetical protein
MIIERNLGEFRKSVGLTGAATTGAKLQFSIPYACSLKAVNVNSRAAGVTGSQITDIQKSAAGSGAAFASIFSGAGKANTSTGVFAADTLGPFTAGATVFAKNDVVSVNITQIHSGTAAQDVTIELCFQRLRGTRNVPAPQLGTAVGVEAE